ncbi:hypothetical protein XA68_18209 [Ophiocordyceps unilateralis]|uniref:Ketosynthase family 3 (KS3) domain-containing protein n=1 Tax=Ophiocordyceps unilateralis TaxID=268505 RepID=A0A2A9PRG6_OPHUN|nr:hypothetical protein XA68_18209 [Ophiocordyceps unilateralis]
MSQSSFPPIAIVGMGLRLPGDVSTPEDFWKLIVNKQDGRCRVPPDRYNVDGFYDKDAKPNQHVLASDHSYFIKHANLKAFDASFFSMGLSEIEILDPQQRLLLEVVWECMENAGQTNWHGKKTGVFVGHFGDDHHESSFSDTQVYNMSRITCCLSFALSNRLSFEYGLTGPRYV